MSLLDQARKDMQKIVGDQTTGFACPIIVQSPNEIDPVLVSGFHTKHYTAYNLDGVKVSSKIASIAVPEQQFIDIGFPIRNPNKEVNMKGFLVDVTDSTGENKSFVVRESFPDETLGLIVLILGDYE